MLVIPHLPLAPASCPCLPPPACSYDHVCKLWDARQSRCLMSVDHGSPIESVAFFPSGGPHTWPACRPFCCSFLLQSRGASGAALCLLTAAMPACRQLLGAMLLTFTCCQPLLCPPLPPCLPRPLCLLLLLLPPLAGSLLVTAGGTDICIWHMLNSGQLVQRVTAHQKTVTSVLVAALAGAGAEPHVLSAGLDGHIKVQ